ncbi:periplasmic heavy metal sensor [uncultured Desulfosarcina sp.]|uniref:periplasmic heavy metal sensor n=1 Tax=uncultured Desulfosarcina sp. TaxID=218289 RepID=UPI0029C67F51|nr:periplasmic heavy metal sensor [uncultured Desulfosarcina sp.]
MKTNSMRTVIVSLAAVAVMAVGATAFAGKGMGNQDDERGYGGYGNHSRRGGCAYGQMNANLTPDQREKMETERQAFFDATKIERQDLYAKRLELRAEMAKSQPDLNKASALQEEVSALQGRLDQKRLSHIMAMRKINPDAGRGFMMDGRGMGHYGMGQGMGYGPGNCPNQ